MSEETATITSEQISANLAEAAFGGDGTATPPAENTQQQETVETTTTDNNSAPANQETTTTSTTEDEYETVEPAEWLRREIGVDSLDVIKQEREEYRKLKEKPQEYSFANDESKKLAEAIAKGDRKTILKILDQQDKLEQYVSTEVNKDTAADIIKMWMTIKYKDLELSQSDIEYKFNKEFGLPKEPVQKSDELDEEFEQRKSEWQEKVNDILTNRVIEAKLLKPELEKAKTELILPDIQRENAAAQQPEPTAEDIAAWESAKNSFIQSAEAAINGFNGINLQVKDKDVSYDVNYTPSQEEKSLIGGKLKQFAESGFDANVLLAERWVAEDGKTLKTDQMIKDLLKVYGDEKIYQKFANESANKRLEAYLKDKKQVNVNGTQQQTFNPSNVATELDAIREQAFA